MCLFTNKPLDNHVTVVCAYSPTNENSNSKPIETLNFYTALNDTLNSFSTKEQIFIAGDFNSQIGSYHSDNKELIGKFHKGQKKDTNSKYLLDLLIQNQLIVTNTKFNHKLAHITTWECQNKYRFNPVRNQIDFILCGKKTFSSVTDSRSYSGATTSSDHRLVICDIPKIKWHKIFSKNKSNPKLDSIKLIENPEIQNKYKEKVKDKVKNDINSKEQSNQNRWNKIVKYCLEAAEETAGFKNKINKVEN